ncbi:MULTISPECIES: hypothetical protein [Leptospira]|uniref:Uncharacterized protein n=1 Tax=Leptospira kirschneri serovar Pomona TaxID=561005 RepID=A0A1T1DGZ2_9LEPT|nr:MULTISPECIES: hypothetical protein [Leptospira]EKO62471.1 hypothetical protein LEP1GSC082_4438 [Leptospira kirschneri str. H2]EKR08802.1 hypothetical protein LEP1GSC122_1574 [Leptospira kirschneri serovar Valbuzzi str. 200702274]EMK03741.1 hypothetical protein LEP1GSC176_1571 [Leptospira kirschneri str. MMD1493]EMK17429.1 hypothetical protein LEP1GSC042_3424 [Leptospira kirschneri serovar Bim str. PUO 1247]EMO79087.1 hypothetical protein LEP1GSC126_3002 [Leptospira kirschneri str. 200801774
MILAHVRGEAILSLLLATPFASLLVFLTYLFSKLLRKIHPTLFKIKLRTYLYLWFLYNFLIVVFIIKNF